MLSVVLNVRLHCVEKRSFKSYKSTLKHIVHVMQNYRWPGLKAIPF